MSDDLDARLLRACRKLPVDATPVWFMRQAGRALPEYRAVREHATLRQIARDAALCAEVTLQPVRRLGVDAAILFADITTPLPGMGVDLEIREGVGPVIERPIRTATDVAALLPFDPEASVGPLLDAIRLIRAAAPVPLIGFAGAPFTLACYLVEGGPSRDFARTKTLLHAAPDVWAALMDRLTETTIGYLSAQVAAGAQVVQVFDSWVGGLSPLDYRTSVLPWMRRIFDAMAALGVPAIHFGTGTAGILALQAEAGGDVIGLDWRIALSDGWERVGDRAVQGNLDPTLLRGPWEIDRRGGSMGPRRGRRPAGPHLQSRARRPPGHRSRPSCATRRPRSRGDGPGGRSMTHAVLLMAYGSPDSLDQVEAYYTDIRRGNPPPPHLLEELLGRYRAIGGGSPLSGIVERQRRALSDELARRGTPVPVYAGMRHIAPRIGTIVERMAAEGVTDFVAIALAPQRSSNGAGYRRAVDAALAGLGPDAPSYTFVESWHDEPRLIEALATVTREAIDRLSDPADARVMFTAHSLPLRVVADGDPYPDELAATAALVAARLGITEFEFAFQSAGRTDEPWLGPDILAEIRRLGAEGVRELVVSPVGFVAEHLEVLYDIDIEAQGVARSVGIRIERARSLNDDPTFIAGLADVVDRVLQPSPA